MLRPIPNTGPDIIRRLLSRPIILTTMAEALAINTRLHPTTLTAPASNLNPSLPPPHILHIARLEVKA